MPATSRAAALKSAKQWHCSEIYHATNRTKKGKMATEGDGNDAFLLGFLAGVLPPAVLLARGSRGRTACFPDALPAVVPIELRLVRLRHANMARSQ